MRARVRELRRPHVGAVCGAPALRRLMPPPPSPPPPPPATANVDGVPHENDEQDDWHEDVECWWLRGHGADEAAGAERAEIVCAGVSCVDMMLLGVERPLPSPEAMVRFCGLQQMAGGGALNTARALRDWCCRRARTRRIARHVLTLIGEDTPGDVYAREAARVASDCAAASSAGDAAPTVVRRRSARTAVSVLPVYAASGGRGCYVDLGGNEQLDADAVWSALRRIDWRARGIRVFHYAYPHLTPRLCGDALGEVFAALRHDGACEMLCSLDVNGAFAEADGGGGGARSSGVITRALMSRVDVLHANLEEACAITGVASAECASGRDAAARAANRLVELSQRRITLVAVTLGARGSVVWASSAWRARLQRASQRGCTGSAHETDDGVDKATAVPTVPDCDPRANFFAARRVRDGVEVNATGAGDAFTAGMLLACLYTVAELAGRGVTATDDGAPASSVRRRDDGDEEGARRCFCRRVAAAANQLAYRQITQR